VQRQTLSEELAKTDAFMDERRKQRIEILTPSTTATHTVGLKEATNMDNAMQTAIRELSREFTTLFQRYNTFLNELSALHVTEAALAVKSGQPDKE
jgi:hypothetical protein